MFSVQQVLEQVVKEELTGTVKSGRGSKINSQVESHLNQWIAEVSLISLEGDKSTLRRD